MLFLFLLFLLLTPSFPQPLRPTDPTSLSFTSFTSSLIPPSSRRPCFSLVFRSLNGTCTSFGNPRRELWASTNRAQYSYFSSHSSLYARGSHLPSARHISNAVCAPRGAIRHDARRVSQLAVFFGQFVDHTLVATPTNHTDPLFIAVSPADPRFAKWHAVGGLPFFRSQRVKLGKNGQRERPKNSLTSVVDLVSVYGPDQKRAHALREFRGGALKVGKGNMLPDNEMGLPNAPGSGTGYFLAGDHRANEHPVLTSLHTVWVREHNRIAAELKKAFGKWKDERLYWEARKVNIAQMQRVVFEEWLPAILGRGLPRYKGWQANVDSTVSVLFAGAAFRVGHTMVGGKVERMGVGGRKMEGYSLEKMFFGGTTIMKNQGIDSFLRGSMWARAQKVDLIVVDALRNFLFRRVKGEIGVDLVAMNLQRCRDHACPRYNEVRERFGLKKVKNFRALVDGEDDIIVERMKKIYGSVNEVEAWIGMVAEKHEKGSSVGETMGKVWMREFRRLRDGDRFFFRRRGYFAKEVLDKIETARKVLAVGNKEVFRDILLRNTGLVDSEMPKKIFFVDPVDKK